MVYESKEEYMDDLRRRSRLPRGFQAAAVPLSFVPAELGPEADAMPMNLSLIFAEKGLRDFAGVFTRNRFPGHPVTLCRSRMDSSTLSGILINNKVANVRSPGGLETAERILQALADECGGHGEDFLSSSTGVIGWQLPEEAIQKALPGLCKNLQTETILPLAEAIMTTDAFPKVRRIDTPAGSIVAIAKGAGMIEPNMATMLCFLLTDIQIPREQLQAALEEAVSVSFNRISVDGDQSTSDMALIFSSGLGNSMEYGDFRDALTGICQELAADIVRNGEGTAHVMRITVTGAASESDALLVGKAVANSALVKTAIYGNDPNVGRLLSAVGDVAGNRGIVLDPDYVEITLGKTPVYREGRFMLDPEKERTLCEYLKKSGVVPENKDFPVHERFVEIGIDLAAGSASAEVLGSDLSLEYVHENADYRS